MDSTTELESVKPERFYQYVDNDITTALKVSLCERNISSVIITKSDKSDPTKTINQQTTILRKAAGGPLDLARNAFGGINLILPPLNISDEKDVSTYMKEPLEQITEILTINEAIFPAQILFPLNLGRAHWVSGQIMIDRETDGSYKVQFSLYDPMSAIPRSIKDKKIVDPFLELFPKIFGGNPPKIAKIIENENFRVGRKTSSGEVVQMQMGGLACGVFATEGLLGLIDKSPQNMWDHFQYDAPNASVEESYNNDGAIRQRQAHIDLVKKHGDRITKASRDNFGRDQTRFVRFDKEDIIVKSCQRRFIKLLRRDFLGSLRDSQQQIEMTEFWDAVTDVEQLAKAGSKSWVAVFSDKELLEALCADDNANYIEESVLYIMTQNLSPTQIQDVLNGAKDDNIKNKIIKKLETVLWASSRASSAASASSSSSSDSSTDKVALLFDKVHKKQKEQIDKGIYDVNGFAKKYRADKELLSYALAKYIPAEKSEEEVIYGAMALLAAGAQISQDIYNLCLESGNKFSEYENVRLLLIDEYCLQQVKAKKHDELKNIIGIDRPFEYRSQKNGDCILHAALENEDPKVFAYFFNSPNGDQFKDSQNNLGISVLQRAVLEKKEEAIKLLIEKGASTDLVGGGKLSDLAKKLKLTPKTINLIVQRELKMQEEADAAKPELDRQIDNVAYLINLCQGVLNRDAMSSGSEKTLYNAYASQFREAGIHYKEQLAEIMSYLGGIRQYLEARKAGVMPELEDYKYDVNEVLKICATSDNEKAAKLAQFVIDSEVVEKAAELDEDDSIAPEVSRYKAVANYKRPEMLIAAQMKTQAEELFAKRKAAADIAIAKLDEELLAALERLDDLKAKPQTPDLKSDIAKLERSIVQKYSLRKSINKRSVLSISKSDFFASKYLQEYGSKVPPILVTPEEMSLQRRVVETKIAENDDGEIIKGHDFVEAKGSLSGIIAVGAEKKFQPYYADFSGIYFKEDPDGTPGKKFIFGEATMFMANFSRGKNVCTFENVDFSRMGGDPEKAAKIFSTMNIDGCVFVNCKFPEGIKINQAGEIELKRDLAQEADEIRAKFAEIDKNGAMDESAKNQAKADLFNALAQSKIADRDAEYPTEQDKSRARIAPSMDRIKGYVSPRTIVHPIAHRCIVIEAAKISDSPLVVL